MYVCMYVCMYVAIHRPRAHHAHMRITNVGKDHQYLPRVNSECSSPNQVLSTASACQWSRASRKNICRQR